MNKVINTWNYILIIRFLLPVNKYDKCCCQNELVNINSSVLIRITVWMMMMTFCLNIVNWQLNHVPVTIWHSKNIIT